jgi:hypothetical protein
MVGARRDRRGPRQTDYLLQQLDIIERINGMIDRCIKRLLMIRGAKSLSESSYPSSRGKKLPEDASPPTSLRVSIFSPSHNDDLRR